MEAESVHHPVVGHLGGIGNEAEHRPVEVVPDGVENLRHQRLPERLPFAVDVGIVPPGKVDPLEGAGPQVSLGGEGFDREFAGHAVLLLLHHRDMAGIEFPDRFLLTTEDGHQGNPFAGEGDHLVVLVVVAGANAAGIPQDEGIPVPDHPGDGVAAVPDASAFLDDAANIELPGDD